MANTNSPFGFKPVIRSGGSPYSVTEYGKLATDAQAIFMFDLVGKAAVEVALPEASGYNVPGILGAYTNGGNATPGTSNWVGSALNYGAASTLTTHMVTDQLDVIYLAQCKTGTTISTTSHVGKNANISLTTAGSTTTKQSGLAVDGATIAATATLDLFITRVSMIAPNAEGDSAILEVLINKHFYNPATAGA